jgi:ABC-2 type transport system ATP-binding protein
LSSDVMIEAKGLTKKYGNLRALDRVSFEVRRGEVVGFLGPNGAGKSTTMRILTCYLSATAGSVRVHGYDVFDHPLEVRQRIGYLPQRAQMYGEMSCWEYLSFVAEVRGIGPSAFRQRMREIVDVCGLASVLGRDIRQLSHGYRQRVGLGQALIHDPSILILDEPTSDLDPNEKAEVIEYIKQIGKDRTVVLSTHNLAEVEEACARAIIVSKGRIVADGGIEEVRARGGRVRYTIVVHEKRGSGGGRPPTSAELSEALRALEGVTTVSEAPSDETAHVFSLLATKSRDLRADIFELCVARKWILLEMRREVQKLEDVFKSLTKGDEALDRVRPAGPAAAVEEEEEEDEGDEDEEADERDAQPDRGEDDKDGASNGAHEEEEDEAEEEPRPASRAAAEKN